MKKLLLSLLMCFSIAHASPTLISDPYPTTGVQPDAATFTINAGTPIACTITTVTGGVQPSCNLAAVGTPGSYTLVLTVTKAAGCTNAADTGTCWSAGTASSRPFTFNWQGGNVTIPVVHLAP